VPVADSEAYCGGKLICEIKKKGHFISIITSGTNMYTKHYDSSILWNDLREQTYEVAQPTHNNNVAAKIKYAIKYSTVAWARWISEVVEKALILHREYQYDMVYSRSLPMIAHVAGYWCSKILNVPWVVNINDPWDTHLFPDKEVRVPWIIAKNSRRWLITTLKNANLITYPCERLWKYTERLSNLQHKCFLIPHIGFRSDEHSANLEFCLVHAGKLGINELSGRPTNAVIDGMVEFFRKIPSARKRTKLILVGPKDELTQQLIKQNKLEENVETVGLISYEHSIGYISQASVCLLIEGHMREGIYLPSKVADYIVAKKPLIALSPARGTINDLMPERGVVRVGQDDINGVANALAEYYKHYCNGTLSEKAPSEALVRQFMPDTVANQFLSAVNEVIGHKKN
jgi:glycosyltransferase involved in cell wall biosynthesis